MNVEDGRVTEVSDGMFRMSGQSLNDRIFPLDLKVKQISDYVAGCSKRFHELKVGGLNHPDLNRELIRRWVELCECRENKSELDKLYESLQDFVNAICRKVDDFKYEAVDGIQLFR